LSDEFELIVPDLRGHGDTDTPADSDFSDAAFASDIVAVLDDRGIDAAHVFGYSLGGWIVLELAASYPSRVRTAIVGGAHPYEEDLSTVRGFTPQAILDLWESLKAPLSEESKRHLAAFDPQVLASTVPDRINQAHRFEQMAVPCMMICGTADWRFDDMRRFAGGNAMCEFVALDGLDHMQAFLQPDRLLPPVRQFIRERVTERAG
jgi:pimeloyl-ACP methyl ester carboxylesterase